MKHRIKQEKGITMVALVVTVIVLVILTNLLIYNAQDDIYIKKLTNLYNDISMLREKVSAYYNEYGKIPAEIKYTNTSKLEELESVLSTSNDTGNFYVIDLEAMQGITLNYGKDYENVKNYKENVDNYVDNYTDLYIINENSHNIFYVEGITIKENNITKTYYTDYTEPDQTVIDLRYIDGILIPDGYYYIGKTADGSGNESIVISTEPGDTVNTSSTNQYTWTKQISKIESKPSSVILDGNQKEYQFIKSVNTYKGYFKNSNGNVQYVVIDEEKWSEAYTKEMEYEDKNGDKVTIPEGFRVSMSPTMNTVENGFVVKDSNDNEWVWVVVPKNIFITAQSNTDYDSIKADLIEYVKDYREGKKGQGLSWTDEWYDGCGIVSENGKTGAEIYTEMYNKMLSSVYTNGGFWISRYEIGDSTATASNTIRTASYDKRITGEAVSKPNQIPYNYVTCSEAQILASGMSTDKNKTSSLLFGIQWDLVCKYLEVNAFNGTSSYLNSNSGSWGNCKDSSVILKEDSRYCTSPNSLSGKWSLYNNVEGNFVQFSDNLYKTNSDTTYYGLLTTGSSEDVNKMNIYDFAGNEWEWTLEHATSDTDYPCSYRGGVYDYGGSSRPASSRFYYYTTSSYDIIGFRSTLY